MMKVKEQQKHWQWIIIEEQVSRYFISSEIFYLVSLSDGTIVHFYINHER